MLATRANEAVFDAVAKQHPDARYNEAARAITLRQNDEKPGQGMIGILAAGTSDLSVAEEAHRGTFA